VDFQELDKLLHNFTEAQLAVIAGIARKLAIASHEKWTGEITFSVPMNQGGITENVRVHRTESIHVVKVRRVRSRGLW
jgi:hypothetical protein